MNRSKEDRASISTRRLCSLPVSMQILNESDTSNASLRIYVPNETSLRCKFSQHFGNLPGAMKFMNEFKDIAVDDNIRRYFCHLIESSWITISRIFSNYRKSNFNCANKFDFTRNRKDMKARRN